VTNSADYITIAHCELKHAGEDNGENGQDCFYCAAAGNPSTHIRLSYCYMHDVNRVHMLMVNVRNSLVEHTYMFNRHTAGSVPHGESISWNSSTTSAYDTLRYNVVRDIAGSAYFMIQNSTQGHFYIYGNVFYSTNRTRYYVSNGVIGSGSADANYNMQVYNNTVANVSAISTSGIYWGSSSADNVTYNNIWYNCEKVSINSDTRGYNSFYNCDLSWNYTPAATENVMSGDPFINSQNGNFHLSAATHAGITLSAPYGLDPDGNMRGADGAWDRGAYEYMELPIADWQFAIDTAPLWVVPNPVRSFLGSLYSINGHISHHHRVRTGLYLLPMNNGDLRKVLLLK
jgi:hypothetical protein